MYCTPSSSEGDPEIVEEIEWSCYHQEVRDDELAVPTIFPINYAKLARDADVAPSLITYFLSERRQVGYQTALKIAATLGVRLEVIEQLVSGGRLRGLASRSECGVNDEGEKREKMERSIELEWEQLKR